MGRGLPTLERYLASLPGGIDAYPECQAKASIARDAMSMSIPPDVDLPKPIETLLAEPPPVSAWIPEVHQYALVLAILDTHFDPDRPQEFFSWVLERNRRLFSSTLYKALFLVLSPERLLSGFQRRWVTFRRGTDLVLESKSKYAARALLKAPPHLHTRVSAQSLGCGFQAAIERAGGGDAQVDVASLTPTEIRYALSWR